MLSIRGCKGIIVLTVIALILIPILSSFAETIKYIYDDLNRLQRMEYGDGSVIEYNYDEIGNREQKATTVNVLFYYLLTIIKTGSGTVASSPTGIDCGPDCEETYEKGTEVTISAIPDAGSFFAGWTGSGCGGTGDCTVIMDATAAVKATFGTCSNQPARIAGTIPAYYSTVQEAYNAAGDGDTIQSQAARFTGDLNINRDMIFLFL
jgi:hypothetical protein